VFEVVKAQGIPVSELQLEAGRLDEVFRAITQPHAKEVRA
jgi:ABC-2 type transport system ATP-binding protein